MDDWESATSRNLAGKRLNSLSSALQDDRAMCLIELTCSYYWEQDAEARLTQIVLNGTEQLSHSTTSALGKTRWELKGEPVETSWVAHRQLLQERRPFRDLLVRWPNADGTVRYLSSSGNPVFDDKGTFAGFRGVTVDVTAQYRNERFLRLEKALADIMAEGDDSSDGLVLSLQAICESQGWKGGLYWHVDELGGSLRRGVSWLGTSETICRVVEDFSWLELHPGEGLAGQVWQTGKDLWIADLGARSPDGSAQQYPDLPSHADWKSAALFPVMARRQVVGILSFGAASIEKPDDRIRAMVQILGMRIASVYERLRTMEELKASEERYASTVELAAIGISHVSREGRFLHANSQLCRMLGYTPGELIGMSVKEVSHPDDANVTDEARAQLHAGALDAIKVEKRYLHRDGSTVWVRITAVAKQGRDGAVAYDIAVVEDVSERKRAEDRIHYLATHDDLTGLPNREMFTNHLEQAIATARRTNRQCAVLFIDLDRFKIVNDSLGHEAGDVMLRELSNRLRNCVRSGDLVARFGGDEFVILVEALDCSASAMTAAQKVLNCVIEPVRIKGHDCRVTTSIGIARFPADATNVESLLKYADVAMYAAKERGKNNVQVYSPDMSPVSVERLTLEAKLRDALERDEFTLHYQPKMDMNSNEIVSVEALLRWWNRDLGTVSPARFIPLAEDTGLILPIGKWVLERACEQNVSWQRQGLPEVVMAVNLSPRQFNNPDLLRDIVEVLDRTGMAPQLLELEITESAIMGDVENAITIATAIKRLGVRLAVDDFGTGYSSLAQLKRFPVDTLKIDQSFIRDLPNDIQDQAITEAIISMGSTLGVRVVAEGVETDSQYQFIKACGCDEVQGFLFSKPCHPNRLAYMLSGEFRNGAKAQSG